MAVRENPPNDPLINSSPLRISGIPQDDLSAISNIADNLDKSVTDFMRPHLRKIVESYPAEFRKCKSTDNKENEMKLRGIAKDIVIALENISSHVRIDLSDLLKPHLKEIIKSYPPKLKRPKT